MTQHRKSLDDGADAPDNRETEALMMPGTFRPRKHRDRKMPPRKPRLNAVWTSQSDGWDRNV